MAVKAYRTLLLDGSIRVLTVDIESEEYGVVTGRIVDHDDRVRWHHVCLRTSMSQEGVWVIFDRRNETPKGRAVRELFGEARHCGELKMKRDGADGLICYAKSATIAALLARAFNEGFIHAERGVIASVSESLHAAGEDGDRAREFADAEHEGREPRGLLTDFEG